MTEAFVHHSQGCQQWSFMYVKPTTAAVTFLQSTTGFSSPFFPPHILIQQQFHLLLPDHEVFDVPVYPSVAMSLDHLLKEMQMSGLHILASYHRSPSEPDCGSSKSLLLADTGCRLKLHERFETGIMKQSKSCTSGILKKNYLRNSECKLDF